MKKSKMIRTAVGIMLIASMLMGQFHIVEKTTIVSEAKNYSSLINDKEKEIDKTQGEIDKINGKIDSLEDEQAIIEEQMEDLNAELINTMAEIGLKEDEIKDKEGEITDKMMEISDTQEKYEAAVKYEAEQYEAMVIRIRAMYERGDADILALLFGGKGLSDILNRLEFVESVYSYDRNKLNDYTRAKEATLELKGLLEQEKASLDEEHEVLEADKKELEEAKAELDKLKATLQAKSDDYEALIKKAKQEASVAQKLLKQEKNELKKLKEEQAKAAKTGGGNGGGTGGTTPTPTDGSYSGTIDSATGSDLGKKIAKYGCQFIGNPYVAGGTSLTSGADCSGFTYRIYSDFGYSIPRTSYQQRSAGTSVSYSEAQPGDLICYDGHVAMYIGGGLIVHASTAKTGIKVSNANYRTILSVRRII